MKNITTLELLRYMKYRAPMYIGKYDIFYLKTFFNGWTLRCKGEDVGLRLLQQGFFPWLQEKYPKDIDNWAEKLFVMWKSEKAALLYFFILFDEFYNKYFSEHFQDLSIEELIAFIEPHPELHISKKSIFALEIFLNNWQEAHPAIQTKVLGDFYLWLQQIYPNEKTNNWANLLFSVFKTEENALKQFFELFSDFCLENSKKDSNSLTLIELIELVRTSPEKYIEKYDVECFHAFLIGYMLRDKTEISDEKILTDFYHWLQKRYIIYDSRGWSGILLLEVKTGEKALDMFFELFDIFLGRTTDVVPPPLTPKEVATKAKYIRGLQKILKKKEYKQGDAETYTLFFASDHRKTARGLQDIIADLCTDYEKKRDKQEIELLARERLGIVDLHKSIFIENNEIRQ